MGPEIVLHITVLLIIGIFIGKIISLLKVPKVTGYLLTGVFFSVIGSFEYFGGFFDFIHQTNFKTLLNSITQVSLGIIIWHIGKHFNFKTLKKLRKEVFVLSLFETTITFATVFLVSITTLFIANYFTHDTWIHGSVVINAFLLGILAISTTPASTSAVLLEHNAQGPLTEYIFILLGLNGIVCITITQYVVSMGDGFNFLLPSVGIGISILLGIAISFVLGFFEQFFDKNNERAWLALGTIVLHIVVSDFLNDSFLSVGSNITTSPILMHLFGGICFVNISTRQQQSFHAMKEIDLPFYILFFIAAGMKLHFDKLMDVQFLMWIYVAARFLGKILGTYCGLRFLSLFKIFGHNLGFAFLSQGGVAIALSTIINDAFPSVENTLITIVISGVMVFEVIGPIAVQRSLLHAGESTPISLSSRKHYKNARNAYHSLSFRLKQFIGISPTSKLEITCKNLMRTGIETIFDTAPFYELFTFFSTHNYGKCIVIDRAYHFIGTISYKEIRDIMLEEHSHSKLPTAGEIAHPTLTVHPNDDIQKLIHVFHSSHKHLDYVPVVTNHDPAHFIGVITQKDVMSFYTKNYLSIK